MNETTELSYLELNLNNDHQLTQIDHNDQDDDNTTKNIYCMLCGVLCVFVVILIWVAGIVTFAVLSNYVPNNQINPYKIMLHVFLWPGAIIVCCLVRCYCR